MIRSFSFLLLLIFTQGAPAANPFSCLDALSSEKVSSEAAVRSRLDEIVGEIRENGATELLSGLEQGRIEVSLKGSRMPWQSMVSGRRTFRGRRILTVRDLTFKSARERQLATWNTAMALYGLEAQSGLWSRQSMLTPDDQRQFDLSPSGSDDALGYFVAEMPAEWRAQKLKQLEKLESELYRLFSGLNELDAADLLPRFDPGRWWLPKAFIGKDASLAIAPNQADFEAWKKGRLASVLDRRHGRSLLFNYYLNFAKRAIVITMAAQLAMAAPQVTQLPGYMEAVISLSHFNQELDEAPVKSEDLNKKYLENLRAMVAKEETRLKREIEKQEGQPNPDAPALNELKAELKDLYDNYPWLLY